VESRLILAGHRFALLSITIASVVMLMAVLVEFFGNTEPRGPAPRPTVDSPLRLDNPRSTVLVV
jgi:hypothetical protein